MQKKKYHLYVYTASAPNAPDASATFNERGHTVHAIIIATTERLHPKLCQQISMLEGRGVKVIHNN